MKTDRQAQQIIEYLLLFAGVIAVIFAIMGGIGKSTERVLHTGLNGLRESSYTYAWDLVCGPCTGACGANGSQQCEYRCQRNDGTYVDQTFCLESIPQSGTFSQECPTDPCPIDCVWSHSEGESWVGTVADCSPPCGTNRSRLETRSVVTPAQFGGAPCTGPSSREVFDCPEILCDAVCGNGTREGLEECDPPDFGKYGTGTCTDNDVTDYATGGTGSGPVFIGGQIKCTDDCTLDISDCVYEECENTETGLGCGAEASCDSEIFENNDCSEAQGEFWYRSIPSVDHCHADGYCEDTYSKTIQNCSRYNNYNITNQSGTLACRYQIVRCSEDTANCTYACLSPIDVDAKYCGGAEERLTSNDHDQVRYKDHAAKCPSDPDALRCAALCNSDFPIAAVDGCQCAAYIDPETKAETPLYRTTTGNYRCCCPNGGTVTSTTGQTITHNYSCVRIDPVCPNQKVEEGEACDPEEGLNTDIMSCSDYRLYLYYKGHPNDINNPDPDIPEWGDEKVQCNSECQWDDSNCVLYPDCTETLVSCGSGGDTFKDERNNEISCPDEQRFVWITCTNNQGDVYQYGRCDNDPYCNCSDECTENYCAGPDNQTPFTCADTDPADRCLEETEGVSCNPPETVCSAGSCADMCTHDLVNCPQGPGQYCINNIAYNCTTGPNGCYVKIDDPTVCSDECYEGECCTNDARCTRSGNICDITESPYGPDYIVCTPINPVCIEVTFDGSCTGGDVCLPTKQNKCMPPSAAGGGGG